MKWSKVEVFTPSGTCKATIVWFWAFTMEKVYFENYYPWKWASDRQSIAISYVCAVPSQYLIIFYDMKSCSKFGIWHTCYVFCVEYRKSCWRRANDTFFHLVRLNRALKSSPFFRAGFIVVASCVMTFEARDSAAKVVPARFKMGATGGSSSGRQSGRSSSGRRTTSKHVFRKISSFSLLNTL